MILAFSVRLTRLFISDLTGLRLSAFVASAKHFWFCSTSAAVPGYKVTLMSEVLWFQRYVGYTLLGRKVLV